MKIAVFGSSGFLGHKSMEILSSDHEVIGIGRSNEGDFKLDVTQKEEVRNFLIKYKPEVVLDTIALTSSMQCENNPELAEKLNYLTAKNISEVCQEIGTWVVFISSSYLFDGEKGAYSENDKTSPINEYARTKIMAEKEILKNPKGIILRVDIMYGYNGNAKKNGVFSQILSGNPINLREPNQIRQPLFVEDVPRIMIQLIERKQIGVFHLAGPERMKMIDFLKKLESLIRKKTLIGIDKNSPQTKTPAIPKNATFDTSKIEGLGIRFTDFSAGLSKIKKQIKES